MVRGWGGGTGMVRGRGGNWDGEGGGGGTGNKASSQNSTAFGGGAWGQGYFMMRAISATLAYSRLQKSCNKQAEQWKTTNRERGQVQA